MSITQFRINASTSEKFKVDTLDGHEYYVVPVIAMIEGVRFGSNQEFPELCLATEFGKFPESWNTTPVVMDHPQDIDGNYISAGSKEVLETQSFGIILNTQMKGKKLHMEAWLDTSKRELSPLISEAFTRLENNETLEVSVGFYNTVVETDVQGTFNGQVYQGVWTNIVPDHLAILNAAAIGACSVAEGCGTRVQSTQGTIMPSNIITDSTPTTECKCETTEIITQTIPTDMDLAAVYDLVREALREDVVGDDEYSWVYIAHITTDMVTYCVNGEEYFQRAYSITDLIVSLGADMTKVYVGTSVTPFPTGGTTMTTQTETTPVSTETTPVSTETTEAVSAVVETENEPSVEEYIAAAPEAIREVLQEGINANALKREKIIATITANKANKFDVAFLKTQSNAVLENIAALASTTNQYAGVATPSPVVQHTDNSVPAAPKVFEKN